MEANIELVHQYTLQIKHGNLYARLRIEANEKISPCAQIEVPVESTGISHNTTQRLE